MSSPVRPAATTLADRKEATNRMAELDLFICHASEDKTALARPLAHALRHRGWSVWYDEFSLQLGDSLTGAIDRGLAEARYGLVILSPAFFRKRWPQRELEGLETRELADADRKVILPVWHELDREHVARFSIPLANRVAAKAADGLSMIVTEIEAVLRTTNSPRLDRRVDQEDLDRFHQKPLQLPGVLMIEPVVRTDGLSVTCGTFHRDCWADSGVDTDFVEESHFRAQRGILRGLHFQASPGQAKLVRCTRGAIFDVIVDVRPGSPTFRAWEASALDDKAMRQLFIPVGFAHGFCVLSEVADVQIKMSSYYDPVLASGFRWNDPQVGIRWPEELPLQMSLRDAKAPLLNQIEDALSW
jgi:dTDP-4-dehydrorhamnose 3,5-epimerase